MFKAIEGLFEHCRNTSAYMRGDFDGPPVPDKYSVGSVFQWKSYKLRPMGSDFRAVMYQNDRIGAQSLVNGTWVDVEEWDDGWSDGSLVNECGWVRMSEACRWSKRNIEIMRETVLGVEVPPKVI